VEVIARLHAMGVSVSIDDFGVGYTSLSYLAALPVRGLKIDRRFVTDLLGNAVDEAVVRNVIHLARDLGMTSLAEGVETPEVWARLAELGCDEIQGYVLTRPLPPDQLLDWVTSWQAGTPSVSQHNDTTGGTTRGPLQTTG
jgi:EAL domain-containing protein (putative c-di-GMP-specific phosphodiesterase class I)